MGETLQKHAAGQKSFILHCTQQLEAMKKRHEGYKILVWIIEGLRKSANRGNYGFLNFPSFYTAAKQAEGPLAWTTLGWLVVKRGERDALKEKLFGTGWEEWEFNEVGVQLMPYFISRLVTLRSTIDNKIKMAENLQTKFLALFLSVSIFKR